MVPESKIFFHPCILKNRYFLLLHLTFDALSFIFLLNNFFLHLDLSVHPGTKETLVFTLYNLLLLPARTCKISRFESFPMKFCSLWTNQEIPIVVFTSLCTHQYDIVHYERCLMLLGKEDSFVCFLPSSQQWKLRMAAVIVYVRKYKGR